MEKDGYDLGVRASVAGICVVVVAALAAFPVPAIGDPLPAYVLVTPADGSVQPAGTSQLSFEIRSVPDLMATVEVTTSPLPGQDGTLADDFKVGTLGYMGESDAFPGTYRTNVALYPWQVRAGLYYFQVSAKCHFIYAACGGSGSFGGDRFYIGPVHSLRIADATAVIQPPVVQPPADTDPSEAEKRECRRALDRQARARRSFNARRRAFRAHRTGQRKRVMNRARRQFIRARQGFLRAC